MTGKIVGEQGKPFVKGSSKPEVEETLETKLRPMITPELTYKEGSRIMDVEKIEIKGNIKYKPIDNPHEEYNYEFIGDAEIGNKTPDGTFYTLHSFRGYFQSDDDREIQRLYNEIQITK